MAELENENKKQRCKNCNKDGKTVTVKSSIGMICQACEQLPVRKDGTRSY